MMALSWPRWLSSARASAAMSGNVNASSMVYSLAPAQRRSYMMS